MNPADVVFPNIGRRAALATLGAGWACTVFPATAGAVEASDLAFVGFELIDEQPDPARAEALGRRLALISAQMAQGLQDRNLYRVVDLAPAQAALELARARNEYLHRCNGCLGEVGAAAGARLVGVGWVQRIGNLILNLNLAIWDVTDDRMTLTKSVDIRGDNEESWRRGVAYMLRDMVERRERQPRYGL